MNLPGPNESLPVVALLGRPNVGKSTLFNYLTRSRDAIVADEPGLTRDRQYGFGRVDSRSFIVVDTGGLGEAEEDLAHLMERQSLLALEEADVAIFVVDGREGVAAADEALAERFRRAGKPVFLTVNKTEGRTPEMAVAEFHALGLGEPAAISAAHGRGIGRLMERVFEALPVAEAPDGEQAPAAVDGEGIRVAVLGRPNVGKSTLINRLVGEQRLVAYDRPGTTRDAVFVPFERDGVPYTLIDTAGVRRKSRVRHGIERLSVIKTLRAIDAAGVVLVVLDAREGITEQDASLVGLAIEHGRAVVLAVNKWDGLSPYQRDRVRAEIDLRLPFAGFARLHFISALHGTAVGDLMASASDAWQAASRELSTSELTRALEDAVAQHQPPLVRGRRIKLRYAHQGGRFPPVIVVHGNQTDRTPEAYRRYLVNTFRDRFDLWGTPVRVEFRTGRNPYEGRRQALSDRQKKRRRRLMKHVKSGK